MNDNDKSPLALPVDLNECMYPTIARRLFESGLIAGRDTDEGRKLEPKKSATKEEVWLFLDRVISFINATANLDIPALVNRLRPSVVRIWSSKGSGSGVFIGPTLIITNAHVVGDDKIVSVDIPTLKGHQATKGAVIKVAEKNGPDYYPADLAVIRADTIKPYVQLETAEPKQGEFALVLGNPLAEWFAVSAGIVKRYSANLLQVDALINPGNSGGAVVNKHGRIIGIPRSKIIAPQIDNFNYSIMVPTIQEFIKDVR